jgi:hypothetical protein
MIAYRLTQVPRRFVMLRIVMLGIVMLRIVHC